MRNFVVEIKMKVEVVEKAPSEVEWKNLWLKMMVVEEIMMIEQVKVLLMALED